MTGTFELRHKPNRKAIFHFRIWPCTVAVVLMATATYFIVASFSTDLANSDRTGYAFLAAIPLLGSVAVVRRAWRLWPSGGSVTPVRLEPNGPSLLKGHPRKPIWYEVPWSSIEAVTFAMVNPPPDFPEPLHRLRVLSFVPHPDAAVPEGPASTYDRILMRPARESVLTFVAVGT